MRREPRPVYGYGLESGDVAALWVLPQSQRLSRSVLRVTPSGWDQRLRGRNDAVMMH